MLCMYFLKIKIDNVFVNTSVILALDRLLQISMSHFFKSLCAKKNLWRNMFNLITFYVATFNL